MSTQEAIWIQIEGLWWSWSVVKNERFSGATQGRRPRGDGGRSPKNLRWGDAQASVPPIFWKAVLSDARESMNRAKKVFFLWGMGSYTTFNIVKIRKIWEKKGKIRKPGRWLKKGHHRCQMNLLRCNITDDVAFMLVLSFFVSNNKWRKHKILRF